MMSMLDVHAVALEDGTGVYHEFLLRYRKNDPIVYGVVEGKDDPVFYQGLIENFLPAGWDVQLIKSGNRKNVLDAMARFDWNTYPKQRICFFIDRDLSMFRAVGDPEAENLFITEKYSIENEAATFGTVHRILHDVLNVTTLTHDEAARIKQVFKNNLDIFQEEMTPIMAQIVCWQRSGMKPALDNIIPKDIFFFDQGKLGLRPQYIAVDSRLEYAAAKVGCSRTPENELFATEREFRDRRGKELFVRGKYMLWFVVESCLEFHRHIQIFSHFYAAAPKVKITMGHTNAMVLVAPRIRCPETLSGFLGKTFGKYIEPPSVPEESDNSPQREAAKPGIFERVFQRLQSIFAKL